MLLVGLCIAYLHHSPLWCQPMPNPANCDNWTVVHGIFVTKICGVITGSLSQVSKYAAVEEIQSRRSYVTRLAQASA
ncbi:hypothetical protein BKA61DRAFT_622499 [Leptodontidium sp. MPI-SDFR-AT-0119]|nr:hypothetical protein BKA61DRAFT_622499 [Leptodontidium sp. MPI-SDFR-AT-0119]